MTLVSRGALDFERGFVVVAAIRSSGQPGEGLSPPAIAPCWVHKRTAIPAGTAVPGKPGTCARCLSSGLQSQQAAHRRIRNAVAAGLDVPGQSALEARILRNRNDHVVPAAEPFE